MDDLTAKVCIACEGGVPPLTRDEAAKLQEQVPGWDISEDGKLLTKRFVFKNFAEALAFTNKVGEIAEQEGHHPDLALGWGYVTVTLTTHAISGLSENDFIVAAKIGALSQNEGVI